MNEMEDAEEEMKWLLGKGLRVAARVQRELGEEEA